ncbi:MAG TPA: hypothetical protein VLA32_06505 [Anaerolineales bacterium]|jgi:flagellar biogenesis protein FliO|nr:hypothetical protein [Anaerolineales bacterium]
MSESMRMWVEVIFNLGYLLAIYWLVWQMFRKQSKIPDHQKQITRPFI